MNAAMPPRLQFFEDVIEERRNPSWLHYQQTANHIDKLGDAFLAKYAATSKHSGPVKSFVKVTGERRFLKIFYWQNPAMRVGARAPFFVCGTCLW